MKGATEEQQIHRIRKLLNALAGDIGFFKNTESQPDGIDKLLASEANFAGISRDFAGIFERAQKLFNEIHINVHSSEAI